MPGSVEERLVSFGSGGEPLHGVLHLPEGGAEHALVFCHPFAEEKKCAHRTMVDAARACARAGWAVLRFDQRGCGDSAGSFGACELRDWLADVEAAVDCAATETGVRVGLLGLRLGATLAAEICEQRDDIACLVLWEPVIDGRQYIAQNLRRSLIKARMTRHEGGADAAEGSGAEVLGEGAVDFDGYRVPEAMREQIESINLMEGECGYRGPVLVLGLAARAEVEEPLNELAAAYDQGNALAVRQEPFWQRIGVISADEAISATVDWLCDLTEDRLRQP